MASTVDTRKLEVSLAALGPDTENALVAELNTVAQLFARGMKLRAAKYRSMLANSINVHETGPLMREIKPGAAYALAQEKGVKPGGKGLPRFFDPASAGIVEWLRGQAFRGRARPRRFSGAAMAQNRELRDRYEGLAWHIRHKGVKATPFVEPTFRALEPVARVRLIAAAQAAMKASAAAHGGTAT